GVPHPDRGDAGGRGAGAAHRQGVHLFRDGVRGRDRDAEPAATEGPRQDGGKRWTRRAGGVSPLMLSVRDRYGVTTGGLRPPLAEPVRVSAPVSHDNLAVYFILGPDTLDDSKVVTLSEALEKGWAVVHETGNVNTLAVENRSDDHDLFLQNGDMIKGGKQDRIVGTDMLVPAK